MPTPLPLINGALSQNQIQNYWDDGYLFPIQVMSQDEAAAARRELEQLEHDWLDAGLPKPINAYKRVNSNAVMPLSYRLASDPRILDVVEGILGPDILIYGAEYFIKEPRTKHMVSMHQDLTYWGLGATSRMVTVWLALSPATPASGCMDFVKGSHKNPIMPHKDTFDDLNLLSRGQEIQVDVAPQDKTAIEIHPGQISLHHGLTIHGSGPNTTDDRRIAFVVRYVAPDVRQEVGEKDYAMLVRGADRNGNFVNYAPPRDTFSADGLAMWEEIRKAQSAVMMRGSEGKGVLYS